MRYLPAGLASVLVIVEEAQRSFDGRIYNATTGLWETATPASIAAADVMIDTTLKEVIKGTMTFPVDLGTFGAITVAQVDALVPKIRAAMKAYVTATTK